MSVCGPISRHKALCEACAFSNMMDNALAVRGQNEAAHDAWRAKWLEGCGQFGRPPTPFDPERARTGT